MVTNYGQDLNIGRPTILNLTKPVEVENLAGVVSAINETTSKVEEITLEVEKIKTGTGLAIGVDLDEEVE